MLASLKRKDILILLVFSTLFFLFQHYFVLSWDFSTYVINAQYWFDNGSYLESLRPPLMSLIIGLFSFLGWNIAELCYVGLVSILFCISSVKLAKALKFNPFFFYALSLSGYVLLVGLWNGTELLSLVLLEFAIVFILKGNSFSGLFLALSALTRYTALFFFPILFLHLNLKKILKSLVLFSLPLILWFSYNYFTYGNFFSSIANIYANNVVYRHYVHQAPNLLDFLGVIGILLPFFIVGIILVLYRFREVKRIKANILMFFLLLYTAYSYISVPIKEIRYLFVLVLPVTYFGYIGLSQLIKNKKGLKKVIISILIINVICILGVIFFFSFSQASQYNSAVSFLEEEGYSECSIISNSWIFLNYLGQESIPLSHVDLIQKDIENGNIIVFSKVVQDPAFLNSDFIREFTLFEDEYYLILGNGDCVKQVSPYNWSYLELLDYSIFERFDYHININPCFTMFHDSPLKEKTCNWVNFNGFSLDEYRVLE
jgi:hypothetical protein